MSPIDEYVSTTCGRTHDTLQDLTYLLRGMMPDYVDETVVDGIPTFTCNSVLVVRFAGYENSVGFFPSTSGLNAFKEELSPYRRRADRVEFSIEDPLPVDLIRRMIDFRMAELCT